MLYFSTTGIIIPPCPRENPTAFDGGQKCCSVKTKINDTGLLAECDGTLLSLGTNSLCCSLANSGPCPHIQCKDAPEGKLLFSI